MATSNYDLTNVITLRDTMAAYKLTDQDNHTYGGYPWTPRVWNKANGKGDLCGPGWLHAYDHPLLAVLHNPLHGNYHDYRLWEAEGGGQRHDDHGLKCGYTYLRILRQISAPQITTAQRVRYAIGAILAVSPGPKYRTWALDWLSGTDRNWARARVAKAARQESNATRAAAERVVGVAAERAVEGWALAEEARRATSAEEARRATEEASRAAAEAACQAARVVQEVTQLGPLDLIALALWAISDSPTPLTLATVR